MTPTQNLLTENKHYLVTGAAGFIGAEVVRQLLAAGHSVVGVDNLNNYYSPALKRWRLMAFAGNQNFRFLLGNIEDREFLKNVFNDEKTAGRKFDAVFNLAARAGVRNSIENPFIYLSTNATGTLNLLETMREHDVKKFILASTSSLYAGQPTPFVETLPVNSPISPYAASKKAAEVLAYTYHHLYNFDVSIPRYFTVFGPAGRPDMAIFRFTENIIAGEPIEVYGDGSQTRDFTYVEDIARGTISAAKPLGYEIINLGGGGVPVPLNDVLAAIEKQVGKRAVRISKPFHAADMETTSADISKAARLLNWAPATDVWSGLEKTVAWHLENRRI